MMFCIICNDLARSMQNAYILQCYNKLLYHYLAPTLPTTEFVFVYFATFTLLKNLIPTTKIIVHKFPAFRLWSICA